MHLHPAGIKHYYEPCNVLATSEGELEMGNTTMCIHLPEINLGEDQVRMLLAIKLFEERLISLGKAAEVAGYSEKLFVEILMRKGISPIDYAELDPREELENA